MTVLGLKVYGHDTGASLVSNGRVVAIAEERLCRVKHSHGIFPDKSIRYCLDKLNIKPADVDLVVIDSMIVGAFGGDSVRDIFNRNTGGMFANSRIETVNHHDAHAASAFFCSPFKESAILIYDGSGERIKTHLGVLASETETLYYGEGSSLHQIQKTLHIKSLREFIYTVGIGKLYSILSKDYLNFGPQNEGKMMGLAPYGNDDLLKKFAFDKWFCDKNGHIVCNAKINYPPRRVYSRFRSAVSLGKFRKTLYVFLRMRWRRFVRTIVRIAFNTRYAKEIYVNPEIFDPINLSLPPRDPVSGKLPDKHYSSVAYAAQKILERTAIMWGRKLKEITRSENICISGGVGLNIDANHNFLTEVGFKNIFVQPASSDTGIGLGAALYGYHVVLGKPRFWEMKSASLGRSYSEQEIKDALEKSAEKIEFRKSESTAVETARAIAEGKIIGWFQGGSEYGPRALGNRSIVCDASRPDMKDVLNEKVKHREPWRPFAASVLREKTHEWFDLAYHESPFMLLAAPVKDNKKEKVPSIVHVDGTCRIQTVIKENNGRYYDLISEFDKLTGIPLVLNTSFNLAGEPIVETPEDALKCFLSTQMDYLVLEDYLISKK